MRPKLLNPKNQFQRSPQRPLAMVDPISRRNFLVPAMRLRRYPPELRDLIIDHLHDDHTSLKSCSLTCHAWLPRSRYHIFVRIKLSSANRDAFRCLLHNTPEIARYIQDVDICGSGGESWWSRGDSHFRLSGRWPTLGQPASRYTGSAERDIVEWLQQALPESTKLLTRVKRLTLSSIPVCPPLTEILRRYFSTVKILVFNGTQSLSFDDYIQFGRAFVDVSAMHMLDARWFPHPCTIRSEEIDKVKWRMTTLELSRTIDVPTLIDWLLEQPHCTDLRILSCFLTSHASAKSISGLLQTLGSKLENLSIGFSDTSDPSGSCHHVSYEGGDIDVSAQTS